LGLALEGEAVFLGEDKGEEGLLPSDKLERLVTGLKVDLQQYIKIITS
jgi:hypothetical protein